MSYRRETENYNLPQYEPDDAMQPVTDFNPAFDKIDKLIYQLAAGQDSAIESAISADKKASEMIAIAKRIENSAAATQQYAAAAIENSNAANEVARDLKVRVDAQGIDIEKLLINYEKLLSRVENLEGEVYQ